MHVLVLDAFPAPSVDSVLAKTAIDTLRGREHHVDHLELCGGDFEAFMSADERRVYHDPEPLTTPETSAAAQQLKAADALLFCYPTTSFTVPAVLKSWMERVLVPGVAFVFDDAGRVRPGMTNIRRIGAVTTAVHSSGTTRSARDAGRRTILWNLRLSCHYLCRRTFVSVPAGSANVKDVKKALERW